MFEIYNFSLFIPSSPPLFLSLTWTNLFWNTTNDKFVSKLRIFVYYYQILFVLHTLCIIWLYLCVILYIFLLKENSCLRYEVNGRFYCIGWKIRNLLNWQVFLRVGFYSTSILRSSSWKYIMLCYYNNVYLHS